MRVMAAGLRSGGDAHAVMDLYLRSDELSAPRPEPVRYSVLDDAEVAKTDFELGYNESRAR